MNMVEKEKDLIGFAHKVISFRMNVIKACKAKGIMPPTDEQISEYINDYGLHFEDFMADFIEHEGMFRCLKTPLEEFKEEVKNFSWFITPTEDEIVDFFNRNGNDVDMFCQQHIIKNMKPLERKVYLKTIEILPTEGLVGLWKVFTNECGGFSEELCERVVETNIVTIITAFWRKIFKSIMIFPLCYERIMGKQWGINYFEEVVWSVITKEVGIEICTETNEMKYIANNS